MSQILLCIESNELKNLIKASFAPYESIQLIFTEDADDIQNFINIFTDVKAIVSEAFIKEQPVTKQIDSILSNRPEPCDLFIFDKEAEEHQQVLINLKLLFGIESEKAEKKSSALTSML